MATMIALEVVRARKSFGRATPVAALDGADLELNRGEIVGLVGPNGAGKSTLLLAMAGMLRLDEGVIRYKGGPLGTGGSSDIGYAPERPAGDPHATVMESLCTLCTLRGMTRAETAQAVTRALETVRLLDLRDRRMGTLSRGTGQRLGLAQALLGSPAILLLDETLSGMDPVVHRDICSVIAALPIRGVTVVLSSHDLSAVEELAARVVVLAAGKVRGVMRRSELGPPGSLRERFLHLIDSPDVANGRIAVA